MSSKLLQPNFREKFLNISKKGARLHNDCLNPQVLANDITFLGGLQALSKGLLTLRHVNTFLFVVRRALGKGRIMWKRIHFCFNFRYHKTKKSSGHRMGHGKGKRTTWCHLVLPGEIFLKVITFSNRYVFLDSFSWTTIFAYFDFYLYNGFWFNSLVIQDHLQQVHKKIFKPFIRNSFRVIEDLIAIGRVRQNLFLQHTVTLPTNLNFISKFIRAYFLFFQTNKISSLLTNVPTIYLFLSTFFSLRHYLTESTALFLTDDILDSHPKDAFLCHLAKFWFFGLLYSVLHNSYTVSRNVLISKNFRFYLRKIVNTISRTSHRYLEKGSDLLVKKQQMSSSSLYSTLHLRNVNSYNKPRITHSSSLIRALRKLSYKTPFNSIVLYHDATELRHYLYYLNKKILKHSTFNPLKKKKRKQ